MKIYILEPNGNKDSHDWEASCYHGKVIVRAKDEKSARNKAAFKFANAVEIKSPTQSPAISPWLLTDLVGCREFTDSIYSVYGPEEILDPEDAQGL